MDEEKAVQQLTQEEVSERRKSRLVACTRATTSCVEKSRKISLCFCAIFLSSSTEKTMSEEEKCDEEEGDRVLSSLKSLTFFLITEEKRNKFSCLCLARFSSRRRGENLRFTCFHIYTTQFPSIFISVSPSSQIRLRRLRRLGVSQNNSDESASSNPKPPSNVNINNNNESTTEISSTSAASSALVNRNDDNKNVIVSGKQRSICHRWKSA